MNKKPIGNVEKSKIDYERTLSNQSKQLLFSIISGQQTNLRHFSDDYFNVFIISNFSFILPSIIESIRRTEEKKTVEQLTRRCNVYD